MPASQPGPPRLSRASHTRCSNHDTQNDTRPPNSTASRSTALPTATRSHSPLDISSTRHERPQPIDLCFSPLLSPLSAHIDSSYRLLPLRKLSACVCLPIPPPELLLYRELCCSTSPRPSLELPRSEEPRKSPAIAPRLPAGTASTARRPGERSWIPRSGGTARAAAAVAAQPAATTRSELLFFEPQQSQRGTPASAPPALVRASAPPACQPFSLRRDPTAPHSTHISTAKIWLAIASAPPLFVTHLHCCMGAARRRPVAARPQRDSGSSARLRHAAGQLARCPCCIAVRSRQVALHPCRRLRRRLEQDLLQHKDCYCCSSCWRPQQRRKCGGAACSWASEMQQPRGRCARCSALATAKPADSEVRSWLPPLNQATVNAAGPAQAQPARGRREQASQPRMGRRRPEVRGRPRAAGARLLPGRGGGLAAAATGF